MVGKGVIGREMNVNIEYSKLLLQAFNEEKEVFPEEVVKELRFIREVANI